MMHLMLISVCAYEKSNAKEFYLQQDPKSIETQFEKLSHFYNADIVAVVRMLID